MTASEFLNQIKKEQLTGREFLALIGHTDISNENYIEIKDNPSMTYSRLVEVFENSPITAEDYKELLKTAQRRKEKQLQIKKRENLENRLTQILSDRSPALNADTEADERFEYATDEINLGSLDTDDDVSVYHVTTAEELWADLDSTVSDNAHSENNATNDDDDDDSDEYGGTKDFDKDARRENLPKIIICLSFAAILFVASFFIRYMNTGSFGVSGFAHKTPQSYEAIFELQSGKPARESLSEPQIIWRASNFTAPLNPLSTIAASNRYLFKITGQVLYAVEFDSGIMSDAPSFEPGIDIIGMFEQNNSLYVICEDLHTYSKSLDDSGDETQFPQSLTIIYEFDALDFTGEANAEYSVYGIFKDAIPHDGGFFIITDYTPNDDPNNHVPVEIQNIEFIKDAVYSNMTLISSVTRNGFELYAVSGNSADCVYFSGKSLFLSFYSQKKDESRIIRYNVYGSVLNNPSWGSVTGMVSRGFINEDIETGIIRIVSDYGDSAALQILGGNMSTQSRSGSINAAGGVKGAAFDDKTAYIIANQPTEVFAVDTSGNKPTFLNQTDALISDNEFYEWSDNRFFSVNVDYNEEGDRSGITVNMYFNPPNSNSSPKLEKSERLSLNDAVWHDYTNTSAELFREAVAANRESGIIIIPVVYVNNVTRVESFFVLNYIEPLVNSDDNSEKSDVGFIEVGKITEIGFNTRSHAAVIRGGYIYTFWDEVVRSAATDLTMIATHEFG
ncbi:MAG: hypothetical protein FWF94_07370 [Oscillospiraceae bacterium]|nr:hypothetical protein [Oscillospiraceae bacterium]